MSAAGQESVWVVTGSRADGAEKGEGDALVLTVDPRVPVQARCKTTWPVRAGLAYHLSVEVATELERSHGLLHLAWTDGRGNTISLVESRYDFGHHDFAPLEVWGVAPAGAAAAEARFVLQLAVQAGRAEGGGTCRLRRARFDPSLWVEAAPASPGGLFDEGQSAAYDVSLSGAPSQLAVAVLSFHLKDYEGSELRPWSVSQPLRQGQARLPLDLSGRQPGYYELSIQASADGLAPCSVMRSFGVLAPLDFEPLPDHPISLDGGLSWPTSVDILSQDPADEAERLRIRTAACRHLGLRSLRDRLSWSQVHQAPGRFDWGRYLRSAKAQREGGLDVYQILHDAPAWSLGPTENDRPDPSYPPADPRVAYELGSRFARDMGPYARFLELWNEPDVHFFAGHPWDLAALTKAASLGIKDIDPGLGILGASRCVGPEFWKAWLANGVAAYIDIFNQHSYGKPEDQFALLEQDREMLAAYGCSLPIWMSEMGMRGSPSSDGSYTLAERIQVSYLLRSYACGLAAGIDRFHCFYLQEYLEYGLHLWGLQRANFDPKPGLLALATLIRQAGSARVAGYLRQDEAFCIVFERRPGEHVGLAWSNNGTAVQTGWAASLPALAPGQDWSAATGSFELPLTRGACLVDAVGRRLRDLSGSHVTLPLSLQPVFIRGLDATAMRLEAPAPNPHFAPSTAGLPPERRVFLQAVARPDRPRPKTAEANEIKCALPCADGRAETLSFVAHNFSDQTERVGVAVRLPPAWALDEVSPALVTPARTGDAVPVTVGPQSTAVVKIRCTPRGVTAGEAYSVSGLLYRGGAPVDQVAVFYKGSV